MNKMTAEFIGTFTLVLFGCGAAVIAGEHIGFAGISFAFGLALVGMAYGIGAVSGCHINPAVSLGAVAAGRMEIGEANALVTTEAIYRRKIEPWIKDIPSMRLVLIVGEHEDPIGSGALGLVDGHGVAVGEVPFGDVRERDGE